jgi:hypothetical protein
MPDTHKPALTPDQWDARDYRQTARDIDQWAQSHEGAREDDSTEYLAKLGLNTAGSVIVMNRAHDRVLIPPPARAPLAAFALIDQTFGFTAADVELLEGVASRSQDRQIADTLRELKQRIQALLPPIG